ncbi:amidohydrolase family protein [Microbacterium sp.]|uniref:amidohydrolase family protein n=1 Tax=Microbacterium sp. TaxID=51671 RepID=UPI003C248098
MTEPLIPIPVGLLRRARLTDGAIVDVSIDDGIVVAVGPTGADLPSNPGIEIDLDGYLLTTAAAEPHGHLDKALSWDLIEPPFGDLDRAVENWHAHSERMTEADVLTRARSAAQRMLANGITAVRSHVDLLPGPDPLRGVRALTVLRRELEGIMDLELVALGGWNTPDEVFDAALDAGVELMGGAPHMSPDPTADLDRLLAIARRRGVGIDLHTDESLEGAVTLSAYARTVANWDVMKSAGHCVRLSTMQDADLAEVIAEVRRADIGIISLPITNLYLQGWGLSASVPRGIAPLRALLDAGVRVAAGADNVRDPFNPVGRCDPLETASLLVTAAHLTPQEALTAVTGGARDVMGLAPAGPRVGARADLLAIEATNVGEAVAFASSARFVFRAGILVSRTTMRVDSALVAPAAASLVPTGR